MEKAPPSWRGSPIQRNLEVASRRPYLYVGNLSPLVSERMLSDLFGQAGFVRSTKIVAPTSADGQPGTGYGFVEYARLASAEEAISIFHGYRLFGRTLRLNWAHQGANSGEPLPPWLVRGAESPNAASPHNSSTSQSSSATPSVQQPSPEAADASLAGPRLFSVFVGDLAPEINDAALVHAFSIFPSLFDARVIWDLQSHRSRGYGFVRFEQESDAATSIATMHGQWLGSRPIRMNWANRRLEIRPTFVEENSSPANLTRHTSNTQPPSEITAVYVGNLPTSASSEEISSHFEAYGPVVSIQLFLERHFAFVTLKTHASAAEAIHHYHSNPLYIQGQQAKIGWARFMRHQGEYMHKSETEK